MIGYLSKEATTEDRCNLRSLINVTYIHRLPLTQNGDNKYVSGDIFMAILDIFMGDTNLLSPLFSFIVSLAKFIVSFISFIVSILLFIVSVE